MILTFLLCFPICNAFLDLGPNHVNVTVFKQTTNPSFRRCGSETNGQSNYDCIARSSRMGMQQLAPAKMGKGCIV